MRKKQAVPFSKKFPKADPAALRLLQRLIAFDPKDRPSAEEVSSSKFALFLLLLAISIYRTRICISTRD